MTAVIWQKAGFGGGPTKDSRAVGGAVICTCKSDLFSLAITTTHTFSPRAIDLLVMLGILLLFVLISPVFE